MDVHGIDLGSSQIFQDWFLEQLEDSIPPEKIVEALEALGTTEAYIRALIVSYWRTTPQMERLIKHGLSMNDAVANETAKGFAVYRRSIKILQEGGPQMHVRVAEMRGALDFALDRLGKLPMSDLVMEAQIGIYIPLSVLALNEQDFDQAIRFASQALFIAEEMNAAVSTARARAILISCHSTAGHVETTAALVQDDRKKGFRYSWRYTELVLANSLYILGNYVEAESILTSLAERTDGAYQVRAHSMMQRNAALWGIGGLTGEVPPTALGEEPFGWITEAMRALMMATATPREGKEAEERAAHFATALHICEQSDDDGLRIYQWQHVFAKWVRATAYLGRGEFSSAAGVLERLDALPDEMFDVRVLSLGAGLELALSWAAPEDFSVAKFESKLRKVFAEAEKIRYASAPGLAKLLQRWHPTAAAYLALMPDPITACAFAVRNVMKVGQQNLVFDDVTLPPVYACDLVLRALDFDLRRDFSFIQSDLGGSRRKKKDLLQQVGEVTLWRQPVSAVRIAYGLLSHRNDVYHFRARSVLATYGIRPTTTALYPMIGTLEAVERATRDLLEGNLTPKGLTRKMLEAQ